MDSNWITSVLRTGAQAVMGSVVMWLLSKGIEVPDGLSDQMVIVMVAAGVIAYTAVVRWLETRDSAFLRLLGRWLMLGLQQQPTYVPPQEAAARRSGGGTSG